MDQPLVNFMSSASQTRTSSKALIHRHVGGVQLGRFHLHAGAVAADDRRSGASVHQRLTLQLADLLLHLDVVLLVHFRTLCGLDLLQQLVHHGRYHSEALLDHLLVGVGDRCGHAGRQRCVGEGRRVGAAAGHYGEWPWLGLLMRLLGIAIATQVAVVDALVDVHAAGFEVVAQTVQKNR